jgi:hypothetical protein
VTIRDMGLDRAVDVTGVQRRAQFFVDGPSLISARLSGVSVGKVRMCLQREAQDPQRECINVRSGTLSRAVFDAGQTEWSVTLIGLSQNFAYATLTIEFNALSPNLQLKNFRFNGTNDPHYNGLELSLGTEAAGTLGFHAEFAGAQSSYQWHLNVANDDLPVIDETGGPDESVSRSAAVDALTNYSVTFSEPEPVAGGGALPALVDVTLTWH